MNNVLYASLTRINLRTLFFLILGKFPNIIVCFLFPVMDVATGEYGDVLFQLTSGVENGRLIYNEFSESILATSSQDGNSVS